MKRSGRLSIVFLLVTVVLSACGNTSDGGTGIEELDSVVTTIESGDKAAIRERLQFSTMPCTTELGVGGPPECMQGEPEGTVVTVFEFVSCEPQWIRPDRIDAILSETFSHPFTIYAAFTSAAGYEAVFEASDAPVVGAGVSAVTRGDRIMTIRRACGAGDLAATLIRADQRDFLIEPPKQ